MTRRRRPGSGWISHAGTGRLVLALAATLLVLSAAPAHSHDPSAWGGLFRSRDQGASWVSANRGPFLSGAIALAISPTDASHLLLGAESGLFRSRNGGRDWTIEAAPLLLGSVFALAFAADGERALASTALGIFRNQGDNAWQQVAAPEGAAPARAIVRGNRPGRVYLAGWTGFYRSDDWGGSWSNAANDLPRGSAKALLVTPGTPETIYVVVQGGIWASVDDAHSWARRGLGSFPGSVDALTVDLRQPNKLLAAGGDGVFRSNDDGANWQRVGQALPEPNTTVNNITVSGDAIIATTDRGLYRSVDGGGNWTAVTDTLPPHLEAGPLLRDTVDPATLYAGFALTPYAELWRRAANHDGALVRADASSLIGGAALLLLLAGVGVAAVRWLGRYYKPSAQGASTMRGLGNRRKETLP